MDLLTPESLPPDLRDGVTYQELTDGQALFQQGDPAFALFIVTTGRLRLFRYTPLGQDGHLLYSCWRCLTDYFQPHPTT